MTDETTAPTTDSGEEITEEEATEPTAPDESEEGDEKAKDEEQDSLSEEELSSALAKARKDAAKYRTRLRDVENQLSGMKSNEDVESLVESMREEREEAERALIRENVALKFGLPDKLAALLQGDDRAAIEAHAKELQEFAPSPRRSGEPRGGLDPQTDEGAFDPEAEYKAIKAARYV